MSNAILNTLGANADRCLNPNCAHQNLVGTRVCTRCGTKLVLRDRYRVEKFIGEGAFGRTFKAVDEDRLNSECVVKQFLPQQMGTNTLVKATELFKQEAERLACLGTHPQIPDLLAFFEQDGRLYLVQQFIDGQDLFKELNQNGRFSESQVRQGLTDLLPVLDFIHEHDIIHRDIKPDNIIRNSKGTLVLVDFGVSKQLSSSLLTKMGTITGTPGYAPSEQFRGTVSPASDLYSLGVTCIRLLTGCLPNENGSDILFDSINMEWTWRQYVHVSDELGLILDKLLQEKMSDRYQSATEVLKALQPSSQPPIVISRSQKMTTTGSPTVISGSQGTTTTGTQPVTSPPTGTTTTGTGITKKPLLLWKYILGFIGVVIVIAISLKLNHKPSSPQPSTTKSSSPEPSFSTPYSPQENASGNSSLPSRYNHLRDLLAARNWKEADEETNSVMLKVAGREKQGFLDLDAIREFPKEDLRTIDDLWVKYSNGKFGFSVQKKIWLDMGGQLDGSWDYDTYTKLGDAIGWRKGEIWLEYSDLTFDTTAPTGHFPAYQGVLGRVLQGGKEYPSLLSRL